MPGAPKEDRKYSAAQSITTGIIAFGLAAALYIPLSRSMSFLGKKALEGLSKSKKFNFPKYKSEEYKTFNYLVNYGSRFFIALPEAYLLFKMLPIIKRKLLSGKDKNKFVNDSLANLTKEQRELFKDFLPKGGKSK
jgi:hypothetical protein